MKAGLKYEIILFWSEEDRVCIAEVPEFPGCMAHGYTQDAARIHAQSAIGLWLEIGDLENLDC